jgi:DNA polymerase elongation subunit (family B)
VFSNYDPIIYGDTDSIYMEYSSLMKTCIGSEDWTDEEKLKFVLNVNLDFLNDHNRKYMEDYFSKRHAKSIQNFELETVAKSGVWLNVKKRYAQILLWKDGKFYDSDSLPLKVKGLEIIKSSYPEMSRESLKSIVRFMLENSTDEHLIHRLNILVQEYKDKFYNSPIDEICGTVGLSNYSKYIISDTGRKLECEKGTPYQVRAAGNYNWLKSKYNLPGDPLRTGKVKWYKISYQGDTAWISSKVCSLE